jgi:hypothetical protein
MCFTQLKVANENDGQVALCNGMASHDNFMQAVPSLQSNDKNNALMPVAWHAALTALNIALSIAPVMVRY